MSSPSLSFILQEVKDAFTVKYVTVAGVVMLLYDSLATIADERQYVWKAQHSIGKYAFLMNRFLVASYSDRGCRLIIYISLCIGSASYITANILVLYRILDLWQDKRMKIFLWTTHFVSSCVQITITVLIVLTSWSNIRWSGIVKMCTVEITSMLFPAVWGAPLFFEFIAMILVIYNTLETPRSSVVPFRRALQHNGIAFFVPVTFLRLIALIISATARQSLSVFWIYFVWMCMTTFLSRSVIRLSEAEMKRDQWSTLSTFEQTTASFEITSDPGSPSAADLPTEASSESYRLHLVENFHNRDLEP